MLSSLPAFTEIRQIGIELALASGAYSRARSAFRESFCGKISLDDTPAHPQFAGDGSLPHACLVQRQDMFIARIALVATNLLLAFRVGQGGKLDLLAHERIWQFWLNLLLWLTSSLGL